jgi:PIN domain nuclease of toxin-antitoxin system
MIVLDTHIWVWWVDESSQLSERHTQLIQDNEQSGLCVSAISCWEVAKLVEYGRLRLDGSLEAWMDQAIAYPGIELMSLTPQIAIESTQLPGTFHRDPADQIIVATARVHALSILTVDRLILNYPHVRTL